MTHKPSERRMSLVIANRTESGEIKIVARVNNAEEITILSRSVAAALAQYIVGELVKPVSNRSS